ncbi:MAG: low molecular weight protein-tyrosine-phosphatase [Canibacter sp.]
MCLGNICRSPMADVIFRELAERAGLGERFEVTSSGIGDWHEGQGADPRTIAALQRAGYDGSAHVAHQVTPADIQSNDLLVALDRSHERELDAMGGKNVVLFTDYDELATDPDVSDPYHSDDEGFDAVLQQIERGCRELLTQLSER